MFNWRKPLIYLVFKKDKTKIAEHLKEFQGLQFWPRERILEYQSQALRKLLLHAYEHVPYYHKVFDGMGLVRNGEVDLSRFHEIPLLTKDIIRSEGERMHSDDLRQRQSYENASGGSTGEPISIIQDAEYRDKSWANQLLYCQIVGKDVGEREIKLWGSERDIFQGSEGLRARLQNFIYNRLLLNSFRMAEKQMGDYVKKINSFKPILIWSYIDSIYELARFIEKNKLEVFSPKAIFVTAGTVYPRVKEYVARIFRAPVYNQYGSREAGDMATECRARNGLHVYEYLYVFEILDKNLRPCGPGEIGEIYVTLLMNYSMPLIRYKIGDTASFYEKQTCICGRNLTLINDVHGRITDHFKRRDGTLVHGEYFTHLFYFRPWIKKFQVCQTDYSTVDCFVVKGGEENGADLRDISDKIKLVMGNDCDVRFQFPQDIPPSRSGKTLYTVSNIQ